MSIAEHTGESPDISARRSTTGCLGADQRLEGQTIATTNPNARGPRVDVSVDQARAVLRRLPLSDHQAGLFKALYNANGKRVLATELQLRLNRTSAQFGGLMGAIGRRFTHTEGFVPGTWFFGQEWDEDLACNWYWMLPSVREALELEGLI